LAVLGALWKSWAMGTRERAVHLLRGLPVGVHEAMPFEARRALRHRLGRYYAWEAGYDHHRTPVLDPGEESGPPEFVGIGVQKAGTSWWYNMIMRHPGVSSRPSIHKERHFFTRFGAEPFGPSDIADYRAWFPRARGTITGEWTPAYFDSPWVPELMAQAAPEAKMMVILRDPIQRFRSGLSHQSRDEGDHVGSNQVRALQRSLYSDSLRRWQSFFPPEQLLVLQYEVCAAHPVEQLGRTYEFLGLDPDYLPPNLSAKVNRTVTAKADLPEDARARLEELVAPDIATLSGLVPDLDLSLWPSAVAVGG
jgi:Sulfotransferase family